MKYFFCVIGDPIEHSRSPEIYAPMFAKHNIQYQFDKIRIRKEELCNIKSFVHSMNLSGFAVTMPHKRTIMPYLDGIDALARNAGSVNIVTVEDGKLFGHNTYGIGLINAIESFGVPVRNLSVVILGHGGAFYGAKAAFEMHSCTVHSISRTKTNTLNDELLSSPFIGNADIVINATPLGMKNAPNFDSFSFLKELKPNAIVADMVYRDGETELVTNARKLGLLSFDGSRMLLYQGMEAFKLWMSTIEKTDKAVLYI